MFEVSSSARYSNTEPDGLSLEDPNVISTCPFGPLNFMCGRYLSGCNLVVVKLEKSLRLSRDLGRYSQIEELTESAQITSFVPAGINKWSSKMEVEQSLPISMLVRHGRDTNRPS